jgi:hypothetical protein
LSLHSIYSNIHNHLSDWIHNTIEFELRYILGVKIEAYGGCLCYGCRDNNYDLGYAFSRLTSLEIERG